jgi:hypothetical protein
MRIDNSAGVNRCKELVHLTGRDSDAHGTFPAFYVEACTQPVCKAGRCSAHHAQQIRALKTRVKYHADMQAQASRELADLEAQ